MTTKDAILDLLWQNTDTYVSGAALAKTLGVSRTAVWKAIEQLREDGYSIDSVTNKGHRLSSESDVLSESGVRKYLGAKGLKLLVYPSISSTNTVLKSLAEEGAEEGLCLIAGEQTAGRGRRGRSFFSPPNSGIYMSVLLRPALQAVDATSITACAAVAVAEAIESLAPVNAEIKWVNDIYVEGKKVCGILTEASLDCENGQVNYLIVGIGINTRVPDSDFPEELKSIAGSAFGEKPIRELKTATQNIRDGNLDFSVKGSGIEELKKAIEERFYQGKIGFNDEVIITNVRHRDCLKRAENSLELLKTGLESQMPEDICAIDLTDCIDALGEITGETMREDLIDEIFGAFCMGK